MSEIIKNLKSSFNMYLNSGGVVLTDKSRDELNELFNKINKYFEKKALWSAPEMIETKAIMSIYKFIPYIKNEIINEHLRVFWNRYLTRYYFKNEFKFSKINDPNLFFQQYASKKLKKTYDEKKYNYYYNNSMNKIEELGNDSVKPLVVKLIEDKDYNFITQKKIKLYLVRSNNTISTHTRDVTFLKNTIDFYDKKNQMICNKGIVWAFV